MSETAQAQAITVRLRIDAHDFENLTANSGKAGYQVDWAPDRFRDPDGRLTPVATLRRWDYAYWFDGYASLILARSFLEAWGEGFLVASDEAAPDYGWVIFTDYASPVWVRAVPGTQDSTEEER